MRLLHKTHIIKSLQTQSFTCCNHLSHIDSMGSLGEAKEKEMVLNSADPVVIALNRLENRLREKERELGAAYCEIKALKVTEFQKDKAVVELSIDLKKLDSKLRNAEKHLEDKNLEIKRLMDEKKEALAAQFAAEATLRRVHANQKDEESVPLEAVIAPYESDIRKYKIEVACLHEDKKALERLIKSKDAALLDTERSLHSAQERVTNVENLQNQNFELRRQIEICQEQNRLVEKANRQKVAEVEKLSQTIRELEESVLSGGSVANVVRDYQRWVSELNEEKKTLERELARIKISANRLAMVAANECKGEGDKVTPVKQWVEERKFLQGEIQRLRDKLAVSERTTKAETQLREKLKLRLKILEESLKGTSSTSVVSTKEAESSEKPRRRSTSQPRASAAAVRTSVLQQPNPGVESTRKPMRTNSLKTKFTAGENLICRKNMWASRRKGFDDPGKENSNRHADNICPEKEGVVNEDNASQTNGNVDDEREDVVSGILYDRLQKEVVNIRKLLEQKDGVLNAKENEIKLLQRKIDALTKAMEVETKRMRREAAAREKEMLLGSDDNKQTRKTTNACKRPVKSPKSRT